MKGLMRFLDTLFSGWNKIEKILEKILVKIWPLLWRMLPPKLKEKLGWLAPEGDEIEQKRKKRKKKAEEEQKKKINYKELMLEAQVIAKKWAIITWEFLKKMYVIIQEIDPIKIVRDFITKLKKQLKEILLGCILVKINWATPIFWTFMILFILVSYGEFAKIRYQKWKGTYVDEKALRIPYDFKNPRPPYYKHAEHIFIFYGLTLPIYKDDEQYLNWVTFTIRSSNRFIINYIEKFQDKIKDHLIKNIVMMDADFLSKVEGKEMLKDKLRDEINIYLRKHKIRGEIEQVFLDEIVLMD